MWNPLRRNRRKNSLVKQQLRYKAGADVEEYDLAAPGNSAEDIMLLLMVQTPSTKVLQLLSEALQIRDAINSEQSNWPTDGGNVFRTSSDDVPVSDLDPISPTSFYPVTPKSARLQGDQTQIWKYEDNIRLNEDYEVPLRTIPTLHQVKKWRLDKKQEFETVPFSFEGAYKLFRNVFPIETTSESQSTQVIQPLNALTTLNPVNSLGLIPPPKTDDPPENIYRPELFCPSKLVVPSEAIAGIDLDMEMLPRSLSESAKMKTPLAKFFLSSENAPTYLTETAEDILDPPPDENLCDSEFSMKHEQITVSASAPKSLETPESASALPERILKKQVSKSVTEHVKKPYTADSSSMAVLLVDDIASVEKKHRRVLGNTGLPVFAARDGMEALAMMKERTFVVVFMDLNMPNMSGTECVIKFREWESENRLSEKQNIIALTGEDGFSAQRRAELRKLGFDDVESKSNSKEAILKCVTKHLLIY
mmetsp:Transcript_25027/g.34488  ORF Transcript_25027/g.34488 Transcript_25027/m.34488 type:complete len:478 (-) Transcript_25027:177-1610(-)|eukprot:CAMPEP_0196582762 /NCGR_PEP_ID=MMETSP1081-20130531/40552_1 /TAXON_ID=36882 /ORGANISM="Pyramimonas amylifera, Strain CCMP720" /LENGTH=477 /DNA_ID=CAMNT_0041903437 /DNA_START=167 /DNA_END=1600 /DNA_ORIENTATION=+